MNKVYAKARRSFFHQRSNLVRFDVSDLAKFPKE
jgi:hypothetical protein